MVFEDWAESRGTQNTFVTGKSFTDSNSNVYQVGATLSEEGDYDAIITKVDRYGDEVWTRTFDGSGGDDLFTDVQVSPSGKVVATGISGSANGLQSSVITAQLNAANGTSTWTQYYSYSGSVYNGGTSITTDGSSNVYVGGATTSISTLGDVLVLKYSDGGTMQWANKKDMHGLDDGAVKVRLNGANVVASGAAQYNATSWRFLTTNFNASTGAFVNASEGTNNATSIDQIKDMVLDASGNIYVTGTAGTSTQGYNMHTIKLDEDLNVVWNHSYNFSGSYDDIANSIALDNSNNVVIAGTSALAGGNTQFTTVKYSNAGSVIWSQAYDITAGADSAKAIATDGSGNIYVSGNFSNGSNLDLKTLKYSPSGQLLWEIDFNNTSNTDDRVLDMTCDDGVVIVAQSGSGVNRTYTTVKYVEINYSPAAIPGLDGALAHGFGANLGQVRDEDGESTAEVVKYYASQAGNSGFYRDNGFDFITRTAHGDTTLADTVQKVAFNFHAPQTGNRVRAFEKAAYFENHYLGANLPKLERIPFYENLLYDKPWNKITLEISTRSGRDYRFTVQPTSKPDDIKLNISGADSIAIDPSGDFKVYTFQGAITFPKPKAYQANGQGVLVELGWSPSYAYTGSQLRLSGIGSYNQQLPLVIRIGKETQTDETDGFCHSTYFGGAGIQETFAADIDSDDSNIICGELSNYSFYPEAVTLISPFLFSQNRMAFAAKFSSDFVPDYMTVFYGGFETRFNAVSVKSNNDIFLGGTSQSGLIVTANDINADYFEETYPSSTNRAGIIVLLEGEFGELLYSTYFSSSSTNFLTDIRVDQNDNLYVVGTTSTIDEFAPIPLSGAYNNSNPIGTFERSGYLAKFTPSMNLVWRTLINGASGTSVVGAIAVGSDNRIAIAGETTSDLDIALVSGTTQMLTRTGTVDHFLMTFNAAGVRTWSSFESSGSDLNLQSVNSGLFGKRCLSFDDSNALYFAGELRNQQNVDFADPGGNAFFESEDQGFANYLMAVKFQANTYSPVWRTQLMPDAAGSNRVSSLIVSDNKLIIGGTAADPSMELLTGDLSLYSGVKTQPDPLNPAVIPGGFMMILEKNTLELLHSTYFCGSGHWPESTELNTLTASQDLKVFAFGNTTEFYSTDSPNIDGIPVFNNGIPGAYFQENRAEFIDSYGFSLCLSGTPLSSSPESAIKGSQIARIYPNPSNPSSDRLWIESSSAIDQIHIYDLHGVHVYSKSIRNQTLVGIGTNELNLAAGIYLIEVITKEGSESLKWVNLK